MTMCSFKPEMVFKVREVLLSHCDMFRDPETLTAALDEIKGLEESIEILSSKLARKTANLHTLCPHKYEWITITVEQNLYRVYCSTCDTILEAEKVE